MPICCECLGTSERNPAGEEEALVSCWGCGVSVHPSCRVYRYSPIYWNIFLLIQPWHLPCFGPQIRFQKEYGSGWGFGPGLIFFNDCRKWSYSLCISKYLQQQKSLLLLTSELKNQLCCKFSGFNLVPTYAYDATDPTECYECCNNFTHYWARFDWGKNFGSYG